MTTGLRKKPRGLNGKLWLDYVDVRIVARWPRNPKLHDTLELKHSFDRWGFTSPIIVDETSGRLVAGHGRCDTLIEKQAAGADVPKNVEVDAAGAWLVPVIRGNAFATEGEAEAYLLADNRITELGGYDAAALHTAVERARTSARGLVGTGFTTVDARAIAARAKVLARAAQGGGDGRGSDDKTPKRGPPRTNPGDLIELGRHRLLCGSILDPDDVSRLIAGNEIGFISADPPYGVRDIVKSDRRDRTRLSTVPGGNWKPIAGDETTDVAALAFDATRDLDARAEVWWGANHYTDHLPRSISWAVWDKRVEQKQHNTESDCELAWVRHPSLKSVRIFRHLWKGMLKDSEHRTARIHPTQKPVALTEWALTLWGEEGDDVLVPFGGSGSDLLACELTGRRAFVLEIEPGYCDDIRARWEAWIASNPTA